MLIFFWGGFVFFGFYFSYSLRSECPSILFWRDPSFLLMGGVLNVHGVSWMSIVSIYFPSTYSDGYYPECPSIILNVHLIYYSECPRKLLFWMSIYYSLILNVHLLFCERKKKMLNLCLRKNKKLLREEKKRRRGKKKTKRNNPKKPKN